MRKYKGKSKNNLKVIKHNWHLSEWAKSFNMEVNLHKVQNCKRSTKTKWFTWFSIAKMLNQHEWNFMCTGPLNSIKNFSTDLKAVCQTLYSIFFILTAFPTDQWWDKLIINNLSEFSNNTMNTNVKISTMQIRIKWIVQLFFLLAV